MSTATSGFAIGPDGDFYVAARFLQCVRRFSPKGKKKGTFIDGLPDVPEFPMHIPDRESHRPSGAVRPAGRGHDLCTDARTTRMVDLAPLLPADRTRLGPSTVRSYRAQASGDTVEVWTLPHGRRFVELSDKVAPDRALARRAELLERLAQAGVAVCPDRSSPAREKSIRLVP